MTFRGVIRDGKVELNNPGELPEGASVDVTLSARTGRKRPKNYDQTKDPAFRISELAVPFGRVDGAAEHDHYIYGTPKRSTARKATGKPKSKRKPPRHRPA